MKKQLNESVCAWIILAVGAIVLVGVLLLTIDVYAASNAVMAMPMEVVIR